MIGLYKILKKIDNAYQLDLPEIIKVYPVFSPDKLRKAINDPLLGQISDPLPSIEVDREAE